MIIYWVCLFKQKMSRDSPQLVVIISFYEEKGEKTKTEEKVQTMIEPQPEAPPVKRYYGRRKAEESDSEISLDSEGSEVEQPSAVLSRNGKHSNEESSKPSDKKEEALSIK